MQKFDTSTIKDNFATPPLGWVENGIDVSSALYTTENWWKLRGIETNNSWNETDGTTLNQSSSGWGANWGSVWGGINNDHPWTWDSMTQRPVIEFDWLR